MIDPVFDHIVGQNSAKSILSLSLKSLKNGGELVQPLFLGEPGLGKTELARSYGNAVAETLGVTLMEYATPKDFRNLAEFDPFLDMLCSEKKFVVYVDECHELESGKVAHSIFQAMVRKALDRQNDGKVFQVADRTMQFDRKTQLFIFATNHTDKVDSAVRSRMSQINLIQYNMDQIQHITQRILEKNGMVCDCPETLKRIASCGRGTARPIVNLVKDVFSLMNLSVIDTATAMSALRMKEMYPAGLNLNEVKVLDLLMDRSLTRLQIMSAISGLHGIFSESIAYLITKQLLDVETSGKYTITPKGKKYVNFCKTNNFLF